MSRLIKKSIVIPENVTVTVAGGFAAAKGAKGELQVRIPAGVAVAVDGKEVWVKMADGAEGTPNVAALLGTTWALIRNSVEGVSNGYTKVLEIEGVGYRAAIEGK